MTSLTGCAVSLTALYVMIYHFIAWVPSTLPRWITQIQKPVSFGHVAVSVFIVLSGFSLMLPVVASADLRLRGGLRGYFKRRCKRILPADFAALAFSIFVTWFTSKTTGTHAQAEQLSLKDMEMHALLIHNLSRNYVITINMAHWSVAAEWQIYFIFALILLPVWRLAGKTATLAVAFALAAIPLLLPHYYNLVWTCPWYIGLFVIGMLSATVQNDVLQKRSQVSLFLAPSLWEPLI